MQLVSGWARNWARLNTDPIYSHSEFGLPVKETVLFFLNIWLIKHNPKRFKQDIHDCTAILVLHVLVLSHQTGPKE